MRFLYWLVKLWMRWTGRAEPLEDKRPLEGPDGDPVLLGPDDLQAGDLLLVYSHPKPLETSWWVRMLDGGWYSHVAFYDGEQFVEAYLEGGIQTTPVGDRVRASHYADVYRFISDDRHEMGSDDWPPDPVVGTARGFLGLPFAVNDLIFGAVVAITRPIDLPGHLEAPLRWFLDRAMRALQRLVAHEETEHLTCSELAYLSFSDPPPPPDYRLRIDAVHQEDLRALRATPWVLLPDAKRVAPNLRPETVEKLQGFANAYVAHKQKSGQHPIPERALRLRGEPVNVTDAVASYVGPRDISTSPNVVEKGRADPALFPEP